MKGGFAIFSIFLLSVSVWAQTGKTSVAKKRSANSSEVVTQFMSLGEKSLPLDLLGRAKAVAVFKDLKLRDAIFSKGIKGKGMFIRRSEGGDWGLPTFVNLQGIKVELGYKFLQAENLDAVFLFMDDESFELISGWKSGSVRSKPKIRGKRIALGPVIGGSGSDSIINEASVIYYTFQANKLSGEEFPVDVWSNGLRIDHDDAMNKSIYKKKFKDIPLTTVATSSVPDEVKPFYAAITNIFPNAN
jgi:lipid-binding SYLF domain-containing protein